MEEIIRDMCDYIIKNIYDDINLDNLEKEFFYNKYYLVRAFKTYTGYTIRDFINTVKVLKTIDPLLFTDDTILKIALNHGFNSQEYYSEKFQNIIGISPLKFRKAFNNIDEITNKEELESKKQYLIYLQQYQNQILNISNETEKIKKLTA